MKQLDVYAAHVLVGHLREAKDGALSFAYAPEWLQSDRAWPLAPHFPLEASEVSGDLASSYFDNLLPEGSVRDFIAQAEHISPGNTFGLLERFGGDTAGALSLLPHGQTPSAVPRYLDVTAQSIRSWFKKSRGIPLNLAGEQSRMSLSGAQDKMTVLVRSDGSMALPLGAAPSSHILKPSMGPNARVPQTAVNEALVMRLAAAIKFDVPTVRYAPELDAVVIARYDRRLDADGRIHRLRQNDLCQVLGIPSARKYETEGGPSFAACFSAVSKHSNDPLLDKRRLLEWLVFNLVVGNMDSHAKNLSLLESAGRTRLAPFYDMVCTVTYPNLSKRFAFKIAGENRLGMVSDRHWQQFSEELGIKPQLMKNILFDVISRVESALPAVASELRSVVTSRDGLKMITRVESEVLRETRRMTKRAVAGLGAKLEQAKNSEVVSPNEPTSRDGIERLS